MSRRQPMENAEKMINAEIAEIAEKTFPGLLGDLCDLCVEYRLPDLSRLNGAHLPRAERLQKRPRGIEIELAVPRFDAEKEPVAARERESLDVEHGVIRHRQA